MSNNIHYKKAFTLIELMLVVLIILALVSISSPLFRRSFDDLKLSSTARELVSILRLSRERAVFERSYYRLYINSDDNFYKMYTSSDGKEDFITLKERWGRKFKISKNITVDTEIDYIDFFPDGKSSGGIIYLENSNNNFNTIIVEESIGSIQLYDYKKE